MISLAAAFVNGPRLSRLPVLSEAANKINGLVTHCSGRVPHGASARNKSHMIFSKPWSVGGRELCMARGTLQRITELLWYASG